MRGAVWGSVEATGATPNTSFDMHLTLGDVAHLERICTVPAHVEIWTSTQRSCARARPAWKCPIGDHVGPTSPMQPVIRLSQVAAHPPKKVGKVLLGKRSELAVEPVG